jgi:alanine transaminase
MEWPELAVLAPNAFPKDVVARAKELQDEIGSIGAYSHSQGVPFIRQNVAKFIEGEWSRLVRSSVNSHDLSPPH